MSKDYEFERYKEFLEENFPTTVWLSKSKRLSIVHSLHSAAFDNLLIHEIFNDWITEHKSKCHTQFLNDFKEYINSVLIATPVNHVGFIGYLIRSSVESVLKLLYSFSYPCIDKDVISRTAFRNLKGELKSAYKQKDTLIKDKLSQLFNLYGKYSKEIHAHLTNNENSLGTINYYTNNYFEKINTSVKDTINLINLFIELVCETLDFKFSEITRSSLIRLEKKLDPSRLSIMKKLTALRIN
ncbi:hypothetical protein [Paenibacillus sp. NPDC055715]